MTPGGMAIVSASVAKSDYILTGNLAAIESVHEPSGQKPHFSQRTREMGWPGGPQSSFKVILHTSTPMGVMRRIRIRGLLLELAVLTALSPYGSSAARPSSQNAAAPVGSLTANELFSRLSPSVFVIEVLDSKGAAIALGSAVGIGKDEVVTNRHVVEDGKSWRVRQGERTWAAKIVFLDAEHDLCGLQVEGLQATPVSLRLSSTLSVGEHVYTLGAPEGLELSLSKGLVSALRRFEGGSFIQTTAPISHGSSGGGFLTAKGN